MTSDQLGPRLVVRMPGEPDQAGLRAICQGPPVGSSNDAHLTFNQIGLSNVGCLRGEVHANNFLYNTAKLPCATDNAGA